MLRLVILVAVLAIVVGLVVAALRAQAAESRKSITTQARTERAVAAVQEIRELSWTYRNDEKDLTSRVFTLLDTYDVDRGSPERLLIDVGRVARDHTSLVADLYADAVRRGTAELG